MSAIFNVILKWSKTPEVVEARFYDEVFLFYAIYGEF